MLPTNAENVHFQGDQVADFLAQPGSDHQRLAGTWEVKLHRRVIGAYALLQVNYQTVVPGAVGGDHLARRPSRRGEFAARVRDHPVRRAPASARGCALPAALQPAEWQSIPKILQQDLQAASANFAYRLVEPVV